jgi:hypothetical protein
VAIFDPFDTPPAYEPARGVARLGDFADTRHQVGNISARIRREGTPSTTAEWDRLVRSAPSAR